MLWTTFKILIITVFKVVNENTNALVDDFCTLYGCLLITFN